LVPDGAHTPVPIAQLPVPNGAFSLGVKVGDDGHVYACSGAFDPTLDAAHVFRVSKSGAVTDLAHFAANAFPNDLAFDDEDNLYVTAPALGVIYKFDAERNVSTWLSDPRLLGSAAAPAFPGLPFGVDGIAFDKEQRHLYVDNLDFGEIFRIKIRDDGQPG